MSDPLSVSASIAGLISLADLTFKLVYKYVRGVKDARNDIQSLADEINGLSSVLRTLEAIATTLESEGDKFDPTLRLHYLNHCRRTLDKIEKRVRKAVDRLAKSKIGAVVQQLKWPFSSSETQDLLTELARHKETIIMALSADTMQKLQVSLAKVDDLGKRVSSIEEATRRIEINTIIVVKNEEQRVLDYFVKISPQPYLELSIKLRHAMTGLWLMDSPDFRDWLETPKSRLWLTGIPGAGKTVLAGSVIQEALERSHRESSVSVAFFFCDYKNADTWEPVNILGAIAAQLARQKEEAFLILKDYYETLHPATGFAKSPDPDDLRAKITEISELFDQTILVLDGLDECGDNVNFVLDVLRELGDYTETLSIAVLSRGHQEIRQGLGEDYESILIEAQIEDVKLYVASEIERRVQNRRLRLADMTMKEEILETLTIRSQGMFRWVVCQLDYLCDCAHDQERREALHKLPPNLPESYRRLLERVNRCSPAVQALVQMCLQFIAIDEPKLTITQLRQAVSTPDKLGDFLDESNTVSEDEIALRCSSLIRKSEDGLSYEFAHFSVREFLEDHEALTADVGKPNIKKYMVSRTGARTRLATQCLRFLQLKNFERRPEDTSKEESLIRKRNKTFSFYPYAVINWLRFIAPVQSYDAVILELSQSLFKPQKTPWFCSWAIGAIYELLKESFGYMHFPYDLSRLVIKAVMDPSFQPLHMAAALSLPQVCTSILNQGAAVSARFRRARPIDLAMVTILGIPFGVRSDQPQFMEFISRYPEFLKNTERRNSTIECLIERGAKASNHELDEGELSIFSVCCILVIELQDFNAVLKLLESGFIPSQTEVGIFVGSVDQLLMRCKSSKTPLNPNIESSTLEILYFIRAVTSEGADWSLKMSSTLWHFAITLNFSYTQLDFIVDSRITMSTETLTTRTVAAVRNNEIGVAKQCLADDRINVMDSFDSEGNTLLHMAVQHVALDVLELLLDMGCDPNKENSVGRFAIQISAYGDFRPVFDIFGNRGISLFTSNSGGSNICHCWAEDYRWTHDALDILYKIDPQATAKALIERNSGGDTPLSLLLKDTSDLSKQKLFHLLDLCPSIPNFWENQERVFGDAAAGGSEEVINGLLRAGAIPEEAEYGSLTPLHSIPRSASFDCVQILLRYYKQARDYIYEGLLPVERYILRSLSHNDIPDLDIVEALFPLISIGNRGGEVGSCWEFICAVQSSLAKFDQEISDDDSDITDSYEWDVFFELIIPAYLKLGAMRAYEEQNRQSGVLPLFSSLLKYEDLGDDPTGYLPVKALRNVLDQTKWWEPAKISDATINYFKRAITDVNVKVLQLLLERGVDIHQRVGKEGSAVEYAFKAHRALRLCKTDKGSKFFQKLLNHSNDRKLRENSPHGSGLSLLHRLATSEDATSILWLVKALVQRGVDVNGTGRDEEKPVLVYHVSKASYQCAELLLDLGADPGFSIPRSRDAAQMAITGDNVVFLKNILKRTSRMSTTFDWKRKISVLAGTKKHNVDAHKANALHLASAKGAVGCLSFYLDEDLLTVEESVSEEGLTPLHIDAFHDSVEITKILLDHGADISAEDDIGRTPLHLAVIADSLPKVKFLVEHGAKLSIDSSGDTPYRYAYKLGHKDILEWLDRDTENAAQKLERQIWPDSNPTRSQVQDLFQYAVELFISEGDLNRCKELFAKHREYDDPLADVRGSNLLFLAINQSKLDIATWFVDQGVNVLKAERESALGIGISMFEKVVTKPDFESLVPKFLEAYWSQGGNLLVDDDYPFHHALWSENNENFKILLKSLVDRMATFRTIVKSDLSPSEAIKAILNRRHPDDNYLTPLHIAASCGDIEIASLLIEHGASVHIPDVYGGYPLERVVDADMAEYLIGAGAPTAWLADMSDLKLLVTQPMKPKFEELIQIFLKHRPDLSQVQTLTEKLPAFCMKIDLSPSRIKIMLQHGIDLMSEEEGGWSLIHHAICRQDSLDFVLGHNLDLSRIIPFPWHMQWQALGTIAFLRTGFKDLSRALPRDLLRKMLNLEPQRGRSPLCEAASRGLVEIIENCLLAGADIDFEGCSIGSALMIASACGHLEAVKLLVSRDASTSYVGANGPRDCLALAGSDEIREWLQVGRFTELSVAQEDGDGNSSLTTDELEVKP
ncbi:ankyrin [Annulohypoxylon maeteangense]|uniref:ankyrin n=1 Tax=Annulohypoxylon maeteangense TaxID=1927788 RepID=UPI0020073531|nr:ankyrin [Annulohypoxylon maeteangense]KAI0887568.1 ankyrin [Annulohypoxylon maeteangense]